MPEVAHAGEHHGEACFVGSRDHLGVARQFSHRFLDLLAGKRRRFTAHEFLKFLREGRILGGDAFFYYLGAYSSANGRWKGEFVNQEHTPAKAEHPLFGGYEVGIGFSGRCDAEGANMEAAALVGKRSVRLAATLKLIQPVAGAGR